MKQLKKTLLTLVALLALTTQAWAGEEPQLLTTINASSSFLTGSQTFDDIATVTFGGAGTIAFNNGWIQDEYDKEATVTVKAVDGYTITSIKLYAADSNNATISTSPFTAYLNKFGATYVTTGSDWAGDYVGDELARIEVYGYQSAPSGTPVDIVWDAAAKTATIAAMPAGNVTVNVKYFAQAELATSTGETPEALAPAAIPNVPANTDAPIVKAGTVANIGTSDDKQGTLMYFVSQSTGNTAPTAPDYDTDGWSENVPTANGLAQGKAYVWYYIKGAEPAQVTDRTDDNTRSDSDIMPLGTDGIVTLAAEPTYDVSLNKTDLADGEPAKWSAKSTNVTTAVNLGEADLKGVKKGETVTVTYSGSKKVLGVKAEKKAATKKLKLTGGYFSNGRLVTKSLEIEYTDNDTWKDIAERYDEVSLVDNINGPEGKVVTFWRDNSQGINGCQLKSNESTYEYKLVSINDKVSAYSSYYLQ